ncbi:hypothetical protein TSOC_015456, partial [Tetrabaena socialis]
MSFQLVLGRAQVKHFKTTVQTLGKIGAELSIECTPSQERTFVLRTINTAQSAQLSVFYYSRYFDSYEIYDAPSVEAVVLSKNALAVFRSPKIAQIVFELHSVAAKLTATVQTEE